MQTRNRWKRALAFSALCAATVAASPAQTFTVLKFFDGTNGSLPFGSLVEGVDANLYGTTYEGGADGLGTVFKFTLRGGIDPLYSFCVSTGCPDGNGPMAGLLLGLSDDFYGVTETGGMNNNGALFQISPEGTLSTLYSFCALANCADGGTPVGGLIESPTDLKFYGTTSEYGANGAGGTIFQFTYYDGPLVTLHSFCADPGCTDGGYPRGGLVQGTDGNFYGTTGGLGANQPGTVFRITSGGVFTTLYTFCSIKNCADGAAPYAGLIQGSDGNFYGTTAWGGTSSQCSGGCGTVFKITPQGKLTTLHSFAYTDGEQPQAGLVQATDGNYYGTTRIGGANNLGTIFQIARGAFKSLKSLSASDGASPCSALTQATDGNLYGTTTGGQVDNGSVYRLSMGLAPFIKTSPVASPVAEYIDIVGNDLTGATSVTFNGTPSSFTIFATTHILALVPAGATTGPVEVTTPSGTLSSYFNFQVLP
jgi:uncharacterized repeat protein (TIGR03803 family)